MAKRDYPKFLLSEVTTGKSQGIFIVHLQHPISLYKFEWFEEKLFKIQRQVEWGEKYEFFEYAKIIERINDFVYSKIADGTLIR